MPRLIIIGAGGLGREFSNYAEDCSARDGVTVHGFLDTNADALDGFDLAYDVIGDDSYTPETEDRFVIALGSPEARALIADALAERGGKLHSLLHPSAHIAPSATISPGCVVAPFAFVGVNSFLGSNVFLNIGSTIGHDSRVGRDSIVSGGAALNGGAQLGAATVLGPNAIITPGVSVGDHGRVAANSVVYSDVDAGYLALGNPARARPRMNKPTG